MAGQDVGRFAYLLRHYRRAVGLTQEALAERAHISVETISNLERGVRHAPRRDTLDLLSDALRLAGDERRAFEATAHARVQVPEPKTDEGDNASTVSDGREHVPIPPTPLIGRDSELAALGAMLSPSADHHPDAQARLLTLVGPPGVGKTRLALEVARAHSASFREGVWFVELAPIGAVELLIPTMARTLSVREMGSQPLKERLLDHLRAQQTLVVLDNFEHLTAAAPFLAELLGVCPHVTLLVTSRTPVSIRAEQLYPLAPLPLPDLASLPPLAELTQVPSVALFVARAHAVQPDLSLSAENAAHVAAICCRLDGLPLAIELAAARTRLYSPATLLARLDRRLDLLTDGPADLALHQRTLRATLDWSYALLPLEAQTLFRRLAVFTGGAPIDAIGTVFASVDVGTGTGADAETALHDATTLDALNVVVKIGLAQMREDRTGTSRAWLLQTVREYALEHLATHGDLAAVQRRFALYFVGVVRDALPELRIPNQQTCAWLDEEHDNLATVLQWVVDRHEVEAGLLLGKALWPYWSTMGHFSEGSYWLEQLIGLGRTRSDLVCDPCWIAVLEGAGVLATRLGALPEARALLEECLSCAHAADDPAAIVTTLNNLAALEYSSGDLERAAECAEAALERCRALGDLPLLRRSLVGLGALTALRSDFTRSSQAYEELLSLPRDNADLLPLAYALSNLGWTANIQGHYGRAAERLEEALTIFRSARHRDGVALVYDNLGDAKRYQGDYASARQLYDECLALGQQLGDMRKIAGSLLNLGHVSREQGNLDDAEQYYAQSAQMFDETRARLRHAEVLVYLGHAIRERGDASRATVQFQQALQILRELTPSWELATCLEGLATVSVHGDQPAHAARLSAAAAALRDRLGMPPLPYDRAIVAQTVERARAALSKRDFAAAWALGQAMPLEEIIAEALETGGTAPMEAPELGVAAVPEMAPLRASPQRSGHNGRGG